MADKVQADGGADSDGSAGDRMERKLQAKLSSASSPFQCVRKRQVLIMVAGRQRRGRGLFTLKPYCDEPKCGSRTCVLKWDPSARAPRATRHK